MIKNKLKKLRNILSYVPFIIVVGCAFFVWSSKYPIPGGYKFFTVDSGSMEPKIRTGSLVMVMRRKNYNLGDIITFKVPGSKNTVTHRIIDIIETNHDIYYKVKGDANKVSDSKPVFIENVIGKVIFAIPYLGFPISFAKTLQGLIVLIVIPSTIIIYSEILSIKNEVVKLMMNRRKKNLSLKERVEVKIGEEIIATERDIKKILHISNEEKTA
ncbi:TPA: signal peptidase I [Candidatus Poribacteria bacterium]|nr:signal peptidase I [Candidatus Poribacteria bacterium]